MTFMPEVVRECYSRGRPCVVRLLAQLGFDGILIVLQGSKVRWIKVIKRFIVALSLVCLGTGLGLISTLESWNRHTMGLLAMTNGIVIEGVSHRFLAVLLVLALVLKLISS